MFFAALRLAIPSIGRIDDGAGFCHLVEGLLLSVVTTIVASAEVCRDYGRVSFEECRHGGHT